MRGLDDTQAFGEDARDTTATHSPNLAIVPENMPSDSLTLARHVLADSITIDTLGGAVVQPTPHVANGSYGEAMVRNGWNVLHACLVSEPSYSPSFHRLLMAVYENLLNFEMSDDVRHIERVDDILDAKRRSQLGVILGVQNTTWIAGNAFRL